MSELTEHGDPDAVKLLHQAADLDQVITLSAFLIRLKTTECREKNPLLDLDKLSHAVDCLTEEIERNAQESSRLIRSYAKSHPT